jgi:hypothetical protein
MFNEILKELRFNLSTIRAIIKTNDRLRNIVFERSDLTLQELIKQNSVLNQLIEGVPRDREWRIYESCTVVTRLYAIYERFVEDLISDYLLEIVNLFPYYELPDKIKNTHREGVGRLLMEMKKNRFQHLSTEQVIRGLFYGVTEDSQTSNPVNSYELFPEAFLLHDQNLRDDILEKILANIAITDVWTWIKKHRDIKKFVAEVSETPADAMLNKLVSYRNEAAHGFVETILNSQDLLKYGDFLEILCQALAELLTYQIIKRKTEIGKAKEIGKITEWFKKPKAAIALVKEISLSVGDSLFAVSENSAYCSLVMIESIKIDDKSTNYVEITTETEVGLQFNIDAKPGLSLYIMT